VHTFLGHVRETVKAHKQTTAGNLIAQLNPMIRGWANYHRHVVSKVVFNKVDTAIFKSRWSWATRRYPKKSRRWVAKKYFRTHQGRQWTFVGTYAHHQGPPQELALLRAGDVPIQRHVKIKGAANPYDPQWEVYFEERLGVKMTQTLKGRRQLLYLWKHQQGLCPVCRQKITRLTGWHNHPVICGPMEAGMPQRTVSSCTPTATGRSIANESREMLGIREQLRSNGLAHAPATRPRRSSRMRGKLQRVLGSAAGQDEPVTEVMTRNQHRPRSAPLGVPLPAATQRLRPLQQPLRQHRVTTLLDRYATCAACGALLKVTAHASRSFRPLVGPYTRSSPRREPCACPRRKTVSCRP
jgi:RNA-directed DNA polymerase